MRGKITAESVNALQAGPRAQFLWDDKLPGFGVKLTPAGSMVYVLQYRMGGRDHKTKRYTIGKGLKPQSARQLGENCSAGSSRVRTLRRRLGSPNGLRSIWRFGPMSKHSAKAP